MKQGLFLIFAFCAISNAYAQMDCESIPSCAELGYTQASCPEGSASLKCPFDETKFYCIGGKKLSDAPAPVVTPEDWTAECADTIAHCTTLDSSCRCTACESGYLLSNGNCIAECDKSVAVCAKENKIFKSDTCTCESCPTNYQFNATTNSCEQAACDITKVANCATYDNDYEPCECTECDTYYQLNTETKSCDRIACDTTKFEHCYRISSSYEPCYCKKCEDGYTTIDSEKCFLPIPYCTAYKATAKCATCSDSYLKVVDGVCKRYCDIRYCEELDNEFEPCKCTKCKDGFTLTNGFCAPNCKELCSQIYPAFDGMGNTKAAIDQIGDAALAAYAASQFYVGDKDGDFGQGKWYLPSIGEWLYFNGTDTNQMTEGYDMITHKGYNRIVINNALNILNIKGYKANSLSAGRYLSSSESSGSSAYVIVMASWEPTYNYSILGPGKSNGIQVRCFMGLNLSSGGAAPQIGDVMYLDKTWSSAEDADKSKTAVGVIVAVSEDGQNVTIVNLKDLRFSSFDTIGNFNPDNPYSGTTDQTRWCTPDKRNEDIIGIQNFSTSSTMATLLSKAHNCPCQFYPPE